MAVTLTISNHWRYQLANKKVDIAADTFKAILMKDTFTFNRDAHATLADVSSQELPAGNGYLQQFTTLSGGVLTEDDYNDRAYRTFNTVAFTAADGNMPASGATGDAIIYDDTTADDTVVGCINFGANYQLPAGKTLQILAITIKT